MTESRKFTKKVRVRISFEDFRPLVTLDIDHVNEIPYPIEQIDKIQVIGYNRRRVK